MFKSLRLLVLLAFAAAACNSKPATPAENEAPTEDSIKAEESDVVELSDAQYKSVGVATGTIQQLNLANYVKATGTIEVPPQQNISISSPYGGILRSINVIEGKMISKGEIVATLENPEFVQLQQDFMENNSQLTYLKQDLTRQEELVKENIAARKALQRVQSDYNSTTSRVEGLKAKLRMINIDPARVTNGNFTSRVNIYAPQAGYVTKVYSNIGKFIGGNEIIADIANTNELIIRVRVFEKDVHQLDLQQRIRFKATGDSIERTAIVFLVGKDIHEDRTVDVLARVQSANQRLLPGMFVNAVIEQGKQTTPVVPEQAIIQSGGKNYIFIVDKGRIKDTTTSSPHDSTVYFKMIEVGVGVTENGFVALILPPDFDLQSQVVLKGAYDLLSKMKNTEEEE